ncbi:MAG: sigma-70 family RNA polymerase sigma factor [Dactylosporangium sp.]|nr:sigma-70 family RNA polymerase sigma factor [Dactylosporangium sp.]NNJ63805.1 sigma-70 family RNA polymerase sigma factor [Dactylosporangium sp.]
MSWAEPAVARAAATDGAQRRQAEPDAMFERFFNASYPLVVRFLWRLCSNHDLVQDAAQEAFITAKAKWETVSGYDKPLIWVRKVARFELMRLLKQQNRQACVSLDAVPPQLIVEPKDPREAQQALLYLLRRLPQRQAAVLALVVDGCTDKEISWELDLTINTVRSYKSAARQKMQQLAAQAGYQDVASRRRP